MTLKTNINPLTILVLELLDLQTKNEKHFDYNYAMQLSESRDTINKKFSLSTPYNAPTRVIIVGKSILWAGFMSSVIKCAARAILKW